jgi:hypothetical protein
MSGSLSQGATSAPKRNGRGGVKSNRGTGVREGETDQSSDERDGPSKDVIFEVLKNSRRRQILLYLLNARRTVTTGELAEHIAAIENDVDVTQLDSKQRKRVYVALYQTHLPKLDREGIVEYDGDRGRITLSDNAAALKPYLDDGYALYEVELWYFAACLVGGGLVFLLSRLGSKTALIRLGMIVTLSFVVSLLVSNHDRYDWESARKLVETGSL